MACDPFLTPGRRSSAPLLRANALSVRRSYDGRMLGLASLAPDTQQALVAGNEQSGLSPTKLHKGVPERWDEQRRFWPSVYPAPL